MEKWTRKDEAELERMLERKAKIMEKNTAPLRELVERIGMLKVSCNIAETMIEHADEIRDVLAPFDSGIRFHAKGSDTP